MGEIVNFPPINGNYDSGRFLVKVENTQFSNGSFEEFSTTSHGEISVDDVKTIVAFSEYDSFNKHMRRSTLFMNNDKIVLNRQSQEDSAQNLVFEKGKRTVTEYETPFGFISLGCFTTSIFTDLTKDGGKVAIDYILDVDGDNLSINSVKISVTPKSANMTLRDKFLRDKFLEKLNDKAEIQTTKTNAPTISLGLDKNTNKILTSNKEAFERFQGDIKDALERAINSAQEEVVDEENMAVLEFGKNETEDVKKEESIKKTATKKAKTSEKKETKTSKTTAKKSTSRVSKKSKSLEIDENLKDEIEQEKEVKRKRSKKSEEN